MARDFVLQCDRKGCGQKEHLNDPKAYPIGWIQMILVVPQLGPDLTPLPPQPSVHDFCGPQCAIKMLKGYAPKPMTKASPSGLGRQTIVK